MAILPQGATSEFLQKAARLNIEVFQYDPKDDHAALWDGVASFNAEKASSPTSPTSKVAPFDFTKRYLAACYARAKTRESAAPLREAVAEGIVSAGDLHELAFHERADGVAAVDAADVFQIGAHDWLAIGDDG